MHTASRHGLVVPPSFLYYVGFTHETILFLCQDREELPVILCKLASFTCLSLPFPVAFVL